MVSLRLNEVRVLGALMEKETTTPEYYPLSLNALVNACNQKSSRDPVMELSEAEVRTALFELESLGLVRVLADGRVSKFEHRAYDGLGVRRPEIAVLGLLLLRGPQTAAELRGRAERMYAFDDTAAVTATLERMAGRTGPDGTADPLVVQMARQPGARESRWMHLLAGAVEDAGGHGAAAPSARVASAVEEGLAERVDALERVVAELLERMGALDGR
ncbi:MAG TPA: YceH family protein [Acidobacteriaceae bacterium]|jgi:uncharacterized protein YceH (UPF0502 family)|nr:YceH family protein [Acidobacteriaceae bacterium]